MKGKEQILHRYLNRLWRSQTQLEVIKQLLDLAIAKLYQRS